MCLLLAWCLQRPEDPLGLELLMGVSTVWVLGIELWSLQEHLVLSLFFCSGQQPIVTLLRLVLPQSPGHCTR